MIRWVPGFYPPSEVEDIRETKGMAGNTCVLAVRQTLGECINVRLSVDL
jgi:hypothetical protein